MVIEKGNKVHVIYRALYDSSTRRHFLGEVVAAEGALCRLEGYVFVLDPESDLYKKKPEKRITIIDLAESGYIVNVLDQNVVLADVAYKYLENIGRVATDGKGFVLDINEFGPKS